MRILSRLILWWVYFPLLSLLKLLVWFIPKIQERRLFEAQNTVDELAQSFKEKNLSADLCFEFSSEGEYQQVASLIDDALMMGKKIELVFFSPSVEKTILDLARRHPQQIRYLRYPILGIDFSSWVTSSQLILVRYDLFPEFLLWAMTPGRKLKFLWVSFKKERTSKKGISLFKRAFLNRSDLLIFASQADAELGKSLGVEGRVYDFRMEQIKRRVDHKQEKFQKLFPLYPELQGLIARAQDQALLVGNAWPSDLKLLTNLPPDYLLVIVPHQLRPEIIESMKSMLLSIGREAQVVTDSSSSIPQGLTLILQKKGILCELYSDFNRSYVGGGFETSIHSVLEPLVAGSQRIACGPMNHRSTEFDVAQSFNRIMEVRNAQEFQEWLELGIPKIDSHDKLDSLISSYPDFQKDVLSC